MITADGLRQLGFSSEIDYSLQNDGGETYIREWKSAQPQPSEAEIEAAHAIFQSEWASKEYARKRRAEYPSIEECVHAILDDDLVALQAKRSAVKEKYPKV